MRFERVEVEISGAVELRAMVEMFCEDRWTGRLAARLARKRARRAILVDILGGVIGLCRTSERYRKCVDALRKSGGLMMGSM